MRIEIKYVVSEQQIKIFTVTFMFGVQQLKLTEDNISMGIKP